MKKIKKNDKLKGPVSTMIVLTILVSLASLILSLISFQGSKTYIGNDSLETSLVIVNNIMSIDGLKFIIGNAVSSFINFEPLIIVVALIGIGICEKSGLISEIFTRGRRFKFEIIVFLTLFIGIISSVIGIYSYIFLIPLTGLIYKYLERSPILGILIAFIGITLGSGTGLIFNYNDYLLGVMTQNAANLDVDPNYTYNLLSNIYIMIISTIVLSFVGSSIINKFLVIKFPKKQTSEIEELNTSSKGLKLSLLSGLFTILIFVYMIIDIKLPGAGVLLDQSKSDYIAKLFSENSSFSQGIVIIFIFVMMVCGLVYGKISGNIKNSHDYSLGLSKNFEKLGFMFVLMFFASQMIAILKWTNIGEVISVKLVDMLSSMQMSGPPLIILFIFIVIIMSFLIPDTITKWNLLSPTVIPLFMRSNITPDFTQFIFKVADSIGKSMTPFFVYFLILLAFLEKYRNDEKKQIGIFDTLKMIMPTLLFISLFWILFIIIWYIIGIPIGVGTQSTI